MENQNSKFIKLTTITDIRDFVQASSRVDGEVLVKRGSYVVDGASVMGVMSIDVSQGCTVIYPSDAVEFDEFLIHLMA